MIVDERFKKGLELFNHKDYFECHEVIEDLWLETPKDNEYRDLYKGVIQAAAAIHQFQRGILTGARGLCKTAIAYLEKYKPEALGLNVEKLVEEMKGCFSALQAWDGERQVLLQDRLVPKLEYRSDE